MVSVLSGGVGRLERYRSEARARDGLVDAPHVVHVLLQHDELVRVVAHPAVLLLTTRQQRVVPETGGYV